MKYQQIFAGLPFEAKASTFDFEPWEWQSLSVLLLLANHAWCLAESPMEKHLLITQREK